MHCIENSAKDHIHPLTCSLELNLIRKMPFTNRVLESPLSYREYDFKEIQDVRLEHTLEKFSVMTMEGTLGQFAHITQLAGSVFSSLAREASSSLDRFKKLSGRLDVLSKQIDALSDIDLADRIFVKTEATENHTITNKFLFMDKSRDESTASLYEMAARPPLLEKFDGAQGDGSCLKKYSDPFFFMQKWIEQERKKQEEAAERRRKRKEARKLKRKGKKRSEEKTKKKRIVVDRVEKKKYNIYGPEFGDEEASHIPVPKGRDAAATLTPDVTISTHDERDSKAVDSDRISAMKTVGAIDAPPLPPPPAGVIANIPVPVAIQERGPSPVSLAPSVPTPGALPSLPQGPQGLIGQIKTGVSLKKAQVSAAPKERGLLDEIRSGKALKKVKTAKTEPKEAEETGGVFGEISKLMERRKFIEDSGDEDSDEDAWE